jgi:soluble lytic murein transglycosylase-like protein
MKNSDKYNIFIDEYSIEFSLEIELIKALIQTESSFNERAYRFEPGFYDRYIRNQSKYMDHKYYGLPRIISASYGLTQIMYTTAEELGFINIEPEILYDPKANIKLAFGS